MLVPVNYPKVKKGLYLIDEYGNIYSNYLKDYIKPQPDKDGYLKVTLSGGNRKLRIYIRVARLVASTFIGEPPEDMLDSTINHIDGNILNNHYSNLEWMERSKNSSIRGNTCKGELNGSCKLTEDEVMKICIMLEDNKYTQTEISKIYNVHRSTINLIKKRKKWEHITCSYNFS